MNELIMNLLDRYYGAVRDIKFKEDVCEFIEACREDIKEIIQNDSKY
jgi:hypothetical protein